MVKIDVYPSLRNFKDTKLNKITEEVPKPPFRIIIVGSSGSGKSNLIKCMLFSKKFGYCRYFNEIYVFSGSKDDVEEFRGYASKNSMQDKVAVYQQFDDAAVKKICDEIEVENNGIRVKNPTRVLFVYDDQLVNGISNISKMNSVDECFIRARHFHVSTIISTQKYTSLNQNLRKLNASAVIVFAETNRSDMEQICKDHSDLLDPKEMMELFKKHLKEKYSFIVIDTKRPYNERILDKNFNPIRIVNDDSDENLSEINSKDDIEEKEEE